MTDLQESDGNMMGQGYAATAPCGCTYALFIGAPDSGIVKDMRMGATIEPVTTQEGNERLVWECPHTPKWGGL